MFRIQVPLDHDQVGTLAGRDGPALVLLAAGIGGAGRVRVQPLLVAERLRDAEDATRSGPARGRGIDRGEPSPMLWCMRARPSRRRWSQEVTARSNALDLEKDVFTQPSARAIAESLRHSAERSRRRKAGPFQSAMSMLNFYINRAGRNLVPSRRRTLERVKEELRRLYGRE